MRIRCAKGSTGFTLVELLTVITIVAILAALGIAGAQKALNAARSAQKISNLKMIGTAFSAYVADNGGRCLPSSFVNTGNDPEMAGNGIAWWCHYLMRYTGGSAKMFCNPCYVPYSSEYPKGIWDDVPNPLTGKIKDELPGQLCRIEAGFGWVWYKSGAVPADQDDWVSSVNNPRSILAFPSPSKQVVCMESLGIVGGPNPSIGLNFQAWISFVRIDPKHWSGPRWSGDSITCLFLDGHVAATKPDDFTDESFAPMAP
jgi:prepilin-type N-terminal cleavage/methylation domain-containing protein/prepilin-type processing-associated H-X9-DG protein